MNGDIIGPVRVRIGNQFPNRFSNDSVSVSVSKRTRRYVSPRVLDSDSRFLAGDSDAESPPEAILDSRARFSDFRIVARIDVEIVKNRRESPTLTGPNAIP